MNDSKAAGVIDQAKGSVKQAVGETFNDQSLANKGAAEKVKGHAEEAWGSVKDAAKGVTHSDTATDEKAKAEQDAHSVRDSITHAAENVKDSIQRGAAKVEHKFND